MSASVAPEPVSPAEVVEAAIRHRARILTSTYNEPLITSEWAVKVFPEARAHGLVCSFVSAEVTQATLHAVFHGVWEHGVRLARMLLKPSMVLAGAACPRQSSVAEVAAATVRCLRRTVPAAVPGIAFLSGGQPDELATAHLDAMNRLPGPQPWPLTFSFARALQGPALRTWGGDPGRVADAQRLVHHRARCASAARAGAHTAELQRSAA